MFTQSVQLVKIGRDQFLRCGPCDWYIWSSLQSAYEWMSFYDTLSIEDTYQQLLKEDFENDKYA